MTALGHAMGPARESLVALCVREVGRVVVHAASEYATGTTGFYPSSPHGLHITVLGSSTSRLPEFGYTRLRPRASARQEVGTIQNGG